MSFIPVDLSPSYPTIKQKDCCNALQFAPPPRTKLLSYSLNIVNRGSCDNGLYFRNLANDFEAHCFDTVSRSLATSYPALSKPREKLSYAILAAIPYNYNMAFKVFISHSVSARELAIVYALAEETAKQGIDPFIPDRNRPPQGGVPARVLPELQTSDAMLAVATKFGTHPQYVSAEIDAFDITKPVLAILDPDVDLSTAHPIRKIQINRFDLAATVFQASEELKSLQMAKAGKDALQILTDPKDLLEFEQKQQDVRRILGSRNAAPQVPLAPREVELQWLAHHPEVLIDNAGKWIALHGTSLVASAPRLPEVLKVTRDLGVHRPLFMYIPVDPGEYLIGMSNQSLP